MRTKQESNNLINVYLGLFEYAVKFEEALNSSFILNEDNIEELIEKRCFTFLKTPLTEEEKEILKQRIKAKYDVYQEEGSAILGDYEHDYSWYINFLNSSKSDDFYWGRYENYLFNNKNFSRKVVEILDKDMKKVMSYIGDPNQDCFFSTRGLVVGDVQSGKTSNYLGLITKAADAGYRVFFILTGTIESLRRQTQKRVEEGFIGYDAVNGVDVGVGRENDRMPRSFTSRNKDFVSSDDQNTLYNTSNQIPMVFVVKKNVSVLSKIYSSLKKLNTKHDGQKINAPCLIIDDEADNASINTNKPDNDPTKINKKIRQILNLFTKTAYVGFTATPFANVFIGYDSNDEMLKDDLFPRDFIYALKSPSNYFGPRKYFYEDNDNLRIINDFNENFPLKHRKEFMPTRLNMFNSFYEAIDMFLLVNAIRDCRDIDTKTNRSMLINMSRNTDVQGHIADIVKEYVEESKKDIKQTSGYDAEYALKNETINRLFKLFTKQFNDLTNDIRWQDVFEHLYSSIKDIQIVVVNSSRASKKLDYETNTNGLRVIAIGGLALSRGLTLEGLCISYFYRNTAVFDVLMQMGRWFGYREDYADLCRIYISEQSRKYYCNIYNSIEELKNMIEDMGKEKKKPTDYGIRVRNDSIELSITARNKMRGTKIVVDRKSFYGGLFETSYLHRDLSINEQNIKAVFELLDKISIDMRDYEIKNHTYFRGVHKEDILKLIQSVSFNQDSGSFDISQIVRFLKKEDESLSFFDVLIMSGKSDENFIYKKLDIDQSFVQRKYDISNDGKIIRMSGVRAHLWGRTDTRIGLNDTLIKEFKINEENARAQDYLIENRAPLLIIYFVKPGDYAYDGEQKDLESSQRETEFIHELINQEHRFLVGLAIGFPGKENSTDKNATYIVNRTQNYYEKEHGEEDSEE